MRAVRLTQWQADPVVTDVPRARAARLGGARRGGRGGALPLGHSHHGQPAGRVPLRASVHARPRDRGPGCRARARARRALRRAIPSSCTAGGAAGPVGNAPTGATTPAHGPSADLTAAASGATAAWRSISSCRRRGTSCPPRGSIRSMRRHSPMPPSPPTTRRSCRSRNCGPAAPPSSWASAGSGIWRSRFSRPSVPLGSSPSTCAAPRWSWRATAGADAVLSADGLTPEGIRAETGPDGATVALDFVGNDATLALAAGSVAQGGDLTFVGRGGGELRVAPGLIPYECTVRMPTWGTLPELAEVVALAALRRDPLRGRGLRPRRCLGRLRQAPAGRRAGTRGRRPPPN